MSVSIVFARCLLDELKRRGIDPGEVMLRAGIWDGRLADLRSRLSFEETNRLFGIAAELSREPALGLLLGASVPLHMLQVMGHMLLSERSLQTASDTLRRFSTLLADGLLWNVKLDGSLASVTFAPPSEVGQASRRCVADFALALLARVSRRFMGRPCSFSSVRFTHAAPSYTPLYREFFACPVYFDAPVNALTMPCVQFQKTQAHADEVARLTYERAALRLLREHREQLGVAHYVRTILRFETDFVNFEPTRVARQLGTGNRTLRRRLARESTSLKKLADEARCWKACQSLRGPQPNIKQIAAELGFADSTSFHRAFRRWTGMTPAAYTSLSPESVDRDGAVLDFREAKSGAVATAR